MRRSRFVFGLLPICLGFQQDAAGQFFSLATPADGSAVYFATPLPQKNTIQPAHGKIFRVDESGLQLMLSRDIVKPPPVDYYTPLCLTTNAYELFGVDVSSDGRTLATVGMRHCAWPGGGSPDLYVTTISTPSGQNDYTGILRLSPNGEWAFGHGLYQTYRIHLREQRMEEVQTLPYPSFWSAGRPIANDGTAVFPLNGIAVVQGGTTRTIPAVSPQDAVIDGAVTFIAYTACRSHVEIIDGTSARIVDCRSPGGRSLHVTDLNGTNDAVLAADGYSPSLSDEGRSILYLSDRTGTAQAFLIDKDGSRDRQITNDPDGLTRAILSGDGRTIYADSRSGRLLQIAVESATARELLPRTPYFDDGLTGRHDDEGTIRAQFISPGSLAILTGAGFTDLPVAAGSPLPASLAGIEVTIGGRPALIHSVTASEVRVLVPPDVAPDAPAQIQMRAPSTSPFAAPTAPAAVAASMPRFLEDAAGNIVAAHENWDSVVSEANPARPGEVIHAYAVGLGATEPAVAFGEAAPSMEPLARLSPPVQCAHSHTGAPVDVLFAGLAPAMVGVYQLDVRLPADASGSFPLWCGRGTPLAFSNFALVGPVPVGKP